MATLSQDIISEILCCLGVEDLLRFRCVSKPWCCLIDSPNFIKLHISRSLQTSTNLSVILRGSYLFSVNFETLQTSIKLNHPLDQNDEGTGTEILGSCNGLLALFNAEEEITLWNPSTRKSQILPVTEIEFPPWFCFCQFIVYGFGYDPISDDYKLIRTVQFYGKDSDSFDSEVKVYSLRTNSWKRILDFPFYLKYKRGNGILANHALHWVVSNKPESDTESFVVAFDLGTENYRLVQLPDCLDQDFHMNVHSLGGFLCLVANYWEVGVVDMWVMKEYGVKESWTKLLSLKQPQDIRKFEFVLPLAYSKSGDRVLLNKDGKKFVWYDLTTKRVKNVRIDGEIPNFFEAEMLVRSLVPLNGNGVMINRKKQDDLKKQRMNKKKRDNFLSKGFHLVL